jgi:hypothetical protein
MNKCTNPWHTTTKIWDDMKNAHPCIPGCGKRHTQGQATTIWKEETQPNAEIRKLIHW